MLTRPAECRGCSLDDRASGFALPEGPPSAPIAFLGEALGFTEAQIGRPFVGDAGGMLQRMLNLLGWTRESVRIGNVVSCRPPNDWLGGTPKAPWYFSAIDHCSVHRNKFLSEPHQVVIALGDTAIRTSLGLLGARKIRVEDFHGTIHRSPFFDHWVVPTYHPSFLQRGAHNLLGTVLWDCQQAEKVLSHGSPADSGQLVIDPPLDWFRSWVDQVLQYVRTDPASFPLSVDVETPDKAHGKDEGEITPDDRSFQILRVNLACHVDEGITVPFVGPYLDELKRLFAGGMPLWFWNKEYDVPRLIAAGMLKEEEASRYLDLMWLWHVLQSDLPRGLGFVAPFYSSFGAWKHLADSEPAKYAAIDSLQTHRIGFGVLSDLQKLGMLQGAMRHVHQLHWQVLKPAQSLGVLIDRDRLTAFGLQLAEKASAKLDALQAVYPEELRPLTPKQGLTRKPAENVLHVKASAFTRKGKKRAGKEQSQTKLDLYKGAVIVERQVQKDILVCHTCGSMEIQRRHRCTEGERKEEIFLESHAVTRWFWSEPFNPDSPPQVLAYLKHRKHEAGKAKKTHKETTNRETLEKLAAKTGDPFYRHLLDYRAVTKVKGTYVEGTERRLDAESRIHPEPTFKPSTQRLCIAEGTPIEVLRDIATSPLGILIEHVKPGDWAYTYDDACRLTLRQVRSVVRTGHRAVVRVHWASANKRPHGYVDLTSEHEVRLVSGEYVQAQELQPGDRMLALARSLDGKRGRPVLYATGSDPIPEHRFAYTTITGTAPEHVHHKNHSVKDNRFENLEGVTVGAHFSHHNTGTGNPRWRHDRVGTPLERRRAAGREWYHRHKNNHRVISIERLTESVDVYDLEVAETHNFIAGEICVHNSYVNPNITNVITDRGGVESLAAGFRSCVVAAPGCRLLEVDFSGSEAVDVGWLCRDPGYIRLAKLGVHAGLASHILKKPYDPQWSDADLGAYFKAIKGSTDPAIEQVYNRSKRFVHGYSYGLTIPGMTLQFPETFPTRKVAEQYAEIFRGMAPKVPAWQRQMRELAAKQHFLGGPGAHPFGYKHWFWSVFTYKKITPQQYWNALAKWRKQGKDEADCPVTEINGQYFKISLGDDGKRCVAFMPQSITAGKLKEKMLALFDPDSPAYIGAAYYGKTPLRAPIHDSLLLEIPDRQFDYVASVVVGEMQKPLVQMPCLEEWGMGPYLSTGVSAKVGRDWMRMEKLSELGVGSDTVTTAAEVDQQEEVDDLGRIA